MSAMIFPQRLLDGTICQEITVMQELSTLFVTLTAVFAIMGLGRLLRMVSQIAAKGGNAVHTGKGGDGEHNSGSGYGLRALDLVSGWGAMAIVLTAAGTLFPGSIAAATLSLAIISLAGMACDLKNGMFWKTHKQNLGILLCCIPLALSVSETPQNWDEYMNWIPNALFLWQHDSFPSAGAVDAFSAHPGYPYAASFPAYAAALLRGKFMLQSGAIINLAGLLSCGVALAELIDESPKKSIKQNFNLTAACVFLVLLVILLGFREGRTILPLGLTSDVPTAIFLGGLALLIAYLKRGLERPLEASRDSIACLSQIALIGAGFVLLRQSNSFLFGLLTAATILFMPMRGNKRNLTTAATLTVMPAALAYFGWSSWVSAQDIIGQFGVRDIESWRWRLMPELLASMGIVMKTFPLFFMPLFVATACGAYAIARRNNSLSATLYKISAILVCGNLVFLVAAYMGSSFSDIEVRHAASFGRYMAHISIFVIVAIGIGMRRAMRMRYSMALTAFLLVGLFSTFFIEANSAEPRQAKGGTNEVALCAWHKVLEEAVMSTPCQTNFCIMDQHKAGFQTMLRGYMLAADNLKRPQCLRDISGEFQVTDKPEDYVNRLSSIKGDISVYVTLPETEPLRSAARNFFGIDDSFTNGLLRKTSKESGWKRQPLQNDGLVFCQGYDRIMSEAWARINCRVADETVRFILRP